FAGHPGWFWMFMIEGLLAVVAGVIVFWYLDNSPDTARFLNSNEKQILKYKLQSEEQVKIHSTLLGALRNIQVWHLALIYMTIQISVYGLIFFLPTQVAELLGEKVGFKASIVAALPWIAALLGTYYIPRYSDRTGQRVPLVIFTLILAGLGITCSAVFNPLFSIIALCFAAIGCIAVQPIFWTIPTQMLTGTALAGGIGFINMFGAFGGFLAPIIRVKAELLFNNQIAGLALIGSVAFIGTICVLLLPVTQTKKTNHHLMN
ncbi:MAG: MFS transporter, partial [Acinetobacter sp.]